MLPRIAHLVYPCFRLATPHLSRIVLTLVLLLSALVPQKSAVYANTPQTPSTNTTTIVQSCISGMLFVGLGYSSTAYPALRQGVTLLQKSPIQNNEFAGFCTLYLGMVHHSIGEWSSALQAYLLARDYFDQTENAQLQWSANFGISSIYMSQGRYIEAIQLLEGDTLNLANQAPDEWFPPSMAVLAKAMTYNNLGVAQAAYLSQAASMGTEDFSDAQKNLQTAQAILEELAKQKLSTGIDTLGQIAADQLGLGDMMGYFFSNIITGYLANNDQAIGPTSVITFLSIGLQSMGYLSSGGDISSDEVIMSIINEVLVKDLVASLSRAVLPITTNNLAETYRFAGDLAQAEELANNALAKIDSTKIPTGLFQLTGEQLLAATKAFANNTLALIAREEGDNEQAIALWELALQQAEEIGHPSALASMHINLSVIYREMGETEIALDHALNGIEQIESTYRRVAGNTVDFNAGLNQDNIVVFGLTGAEDQYADAYANAVQLYHQLGMDEDALLMAERGRTRRFLDMLAASQLSLSEEDTAQLNTLQELLTTQKLVEQNLKMQQIYPDLDLVTIRKLESDAAKLDKQIAAQQALLDPQLENLINGDAAIQDVEAIRELLPNEQTSLVTYYLTGEEGVAWVISQDDFTTVTLPISRTLLLSDINHLRNTISTNKTHAATNAALYDALIRPLHTSLTGEELILVAHDALHYLPFGSLWDEQEQQYLVEQFTLTQVPSISSLPYIVNNRNAHQGVALILGNPDSTLKEAATEAKNIADLLGGEALLEADATKSALIQQAPEVDILHMAAHGIYDTNAPLRSRIELATDGGKENGKEDGALYVSDVFALDLSNANLVVLSACETALGERSLGDEVVGLTRAFLYAGTPAIITTLWKIPDTHTNQLMTSFYQSLQSGQSPAVALQQAQIAMAQQGLDPYYWAAFVLTGDGSNPLISDAAE